MASLETWIYTIIRSGVKGGLFTSKPGVAKIDKIRYNDC
jgi:hypothetical protein